MTQISREDVLSLARLSSIKLADEEIDALSTDLAKIIEYVTQLDELDTEGVAPTYQVNGLENRWRDDVIESSVDSETLLKLAPKSKNNQIEVPKVLAA